MKAIPSMIFLLRGVVRIHPWVRNAPSGRQVNPGTSYPGRSGLIYNITSTK